MRNVGMTQASPASPPISILIDSMAGGGTESVALRLARGFTERGHNVDLLLLSPEGDYRDEIFSRLSIYYFRSKIRSPALLDHFRSHGIQARRVDRNPLHELFAKRQLRSLYPSLHISGYWIRQALRMSRYIRSRKPKTVLSISHDPNVITILGRHLADQPSLSLIVSIHNNVELAPHYPQAEIAAMYPAATAVVCVSQGVSDSAIRTCGLPKNRVFTIYNPVPHLEIRRMSQDEVAHPWFTDDKIPVIFAVGRAVPAKDHHTLISAFALIRKRREARLAIMSSSTPEQISPLLLHAAALGVEESFEVLGFDPNPFRYMRRSSCFVLSSIFEGLALVLIEAMACGTPVVSTDAPYGPREILGEGGKWGRLVDVGNPEQMASAILETLEADKEKESAKLMERARFFCAERATNEYLSLMHDLSGGKVLDA